MRTASHVTCSADSRVADWPLVRSPLPTLALCLSYVLVVKFLGPRVMRQRQALDLRYLMVAYNLAMVVVSTWLFVKMGA